MSSRALHPEGNPRTFFCPIDRNPVSYPDLTQYLTVPDDTALVLDLLEGKLNTAVCPLCGERIPVSTPVIVDIPEAKLLIVHTAGASVPPEILAKMPADIQIAHADDYNELRRLVIAELDRWIVPALQLLLGGGFERLSRAQRIHALTPFFLRIFKSQLDGFLPPLVQFSGTATPEQGQQILRDLYAQTVSTLFDLISLEAARERRVLQLHEAIVERVPSECCTREVLAKVAERCIDVSDPLQDAQRFMIGFRQEHLNAEAHAHGGAENPRARTWATYVAAVWFLSRRSDVELDDQAKLSPAIIRRTLHFRDLWDAVAPYVQSSVDGKAAQPATLVESLTAMATQFGFEDELFHLLDESGGLLRMRLETPEDRASAHQAFREVLRGKAQWNESAETSSAIGGHVASALHNFVASSAVSEGLVLTDEFFQQAVDAADAIAIESIASHAAKILNRFELYEEASELLARAADVLGPRLKDLSPARALSFLNELGNACRYRHKYTEALDAYEHAEGLLDAEPPDQRESDAAVLRRNKAIVLRDMGRYGEALTLLRREEQERIDDSEVQHSLAVLFFRVGRLGEALQRIEQALALYKGTPGSPIRINYLATRGSLRALIGNAEGSLADFAEALGRYPRGAAAPRSRVMSAILGIAGTSTAIVEARARTRREAEQLLSASSALSMDHRVTLSSQIAAEALRAGDVAGAAQILDRLQHEIEITGASVPWQVNHQLGELYLRQGDVNRSWHVIRDALAHINEAVPTGSDATFAPFWLFDKASLQETATVIALKRAQTGAPNADAELLEIYDFANGREIAARLDGDISRREKTPLRARLTEIASRLDVPIRVVFFLEGAGSLYMASVTGTHGQVSLNPPFPFTLADVTAARELFAEAMRRVNPANPAAVDTAIAAWFDIAKAIGVELSRVLAPGEHICFLPGRALSGLPLHLVPLPGGVRLAERHTVMYAPNFAVLLADAANVARGRTTIVNVAKASDDVAFRERARQTADAIRRTLLASGEAVLLEGLAASRESVCQAMDDSSEMLLLCHGRHADAERGVGVCLSDGVNLPPPIIAVADVPDHFRFLLTWEDVVSAPRSVVSIACSSGNAEIGPAGVRFGLEQTLFAGGTRSLISPLWDIDQHAALLWVKEFYDARVNEGRMAAVAYQQASLRTARRFPHFYHWGCFTVNGSLLGVASE